MTGVSREPAAGMHGQPEVGTGSSQQSAKDRPWLAKTAVHKPATDSGAPAADTAVSTNLFPGCAGVNGHTNTTSGPSFSPLAVLLPVPTLRLPVLGRCWLRCGHRNLGLVHHLHQTDLR